MPTATDGLELLPAAMDCRQLATSLATERRQRMEGLPKENYYGHFGNFGSGQKARLSSPLPPSSSGSGTVMIGHIPATRYRRAEQMPENIEKARQKIPRPDKYHRGAVSTFHPREKRMICLCYSKLNLLSILTSKRAFEVMQKHFQHIPVPQEDRYFLNELSYGRCWRCLG